MCGIFIEIIKIHSGTAQFLGPKRLLAVLAAFGNFKNDPHAAKIANYLLGPRNCAVPE